jgi:sterol 24-C-methyltransferase
MWRLFGLLGYMPYQVFKLLGVQDRFVNTMAAVETRSHWGDCRYMKLRAIKP